MKTISERLFDGSFSGVPEEIVLDIGNEVDAVKETVQIDQAIYTSTAWMVKKYAGDPPVGEARGKWFNACIGIGEEVYAMCCKRYPTEDIAMMQKQATAAAYRGTIDVLIAKLGAIKAKNYSITKE